MVLGSGRRVGAWGMATGAALVAVGVIVLQIAALALQRQAAQLDPSQTRLDATSGNAATGGILAGIGLAVFLVFCIPFLVGSARVRKRGVKLDHPPGVAAGVSGVAVLALVLYALLAPGGPLQLTMATASGGGHGAVEVHMFEGMLNATATVAGHATSENTHAIPLVAHSGAIRLRIGSGTQPPLPQAYAIAILEAPDGAGGWKEIGRTSASADSTLDVPSATYLGDLRVRVQIADGSAGSVGYKGAVSLAPSA